MLKLVALLLLVSSVYALVPATPTGSDGSAVLRPGQKVSLTWEEPAGFTATTVSLFSGPTYNNTKPNWKLDIQDIRKNFDMTNQQSIEWTVPLVTPCQQIYYLLYWNAGQQVRYTDRFAICRGDEKPDDVAGNGQYKNGWAITVDSTVSPGNQYSDLKNGNGTASVDLTSMPKASSTKVNKQQESGSYSSTTTVTVTGTQADGDEEEATASLESTDDDTDLNSESGGSNGADSDDSGLTTDESGALRQAASSISTMLALNTALMAALLSIGL